MPKTEPRFVPPKAYALSMATVLLEKIIILSQRKPLTLRDNMEIHQLATHAVNHLKGIQ